MALQTSGAIDLNAIHVEAGGTSGTSVTINDSDIRGLTAASGYTIPTSSGSTIDFGDFYGATAWTHVLTQGYYTAGGVTYSGKFSTITGSVSPTSYSGYTVFSLMKMSTLSTYLWLYMSPLPAANVFTTLTFEASDGTVISVDSADATTASLVSMRYWTWPPATFDTGHNAKMSSTFDGSGTINVTFS
jgi:hypothetical protein